MPAAPAVIFEAHETITLDADAPLPAGAGRPLVLMVHGYATHRNALYQRPLAKGLLPTHASLRIDLSGNGDSTGTFHYLERYAEDHYADVAFLVDAFRAAGWDPVALVGHSRGATTCMLYCLRHPFSVPALIVLSGRSRIQRGLQLKHPSEFGADRPTLEFTHPLANGRTVTTSENKAEVLAHLARVDLEYTQVPYLPPSLRVLILHGTQDTTVPIEDAAWLVSNIPNAELRLLPAGHNWNNDAMKQTGEPIRTICSWLRKPSMTQLLKMMKDPTVRLGALRNFRDVGGLVVRAPPPDLRPAATGATPTPPGTLRVATGRLYRAGTLSDLDPAHLAHLRHRNIVHVFDLRSAREVKRAPYTLPEGMVAHHLPCSSGHDHGRGGDGGSNGGDDDDLSPLALAQSYRVFTQGPAGFCRAYQQILACSGPTLRDFYMHLASPEAATTATLVHCAAGKDRTGVCVAVLLSFLGVADALVAAEYSLTERLLVYTPEQKAAFFRMLDGHLTLEEITAMAAAPMDAMLMTLQAIRDRWGSARGYLRQIGVTDAALQILCDRFLVATLRDTPVFGHSVPSL